MPAASSAKPLAGRGGLRGGAVTLGSSGRGGLGLQSSEEIASEDFIEILDEVQKDDKIKAVIIRVDSPGGAAFASDLI